MNIIRRDVIYFYKLFASTNRLMWSLRRYYGHSTAIAYLGIRVDELLVCLHRGAGGSWSLVLFLARGGCRGGGSTCSDVVDLGLNDVLQILGN